MLHRVRMYVNSMFEMFVYGSNLLRNYNCRFAVTTTCLRSYHSSTTVRMLALQLLLLAVLLGYSSSSAKHLVEHSAYLYCMTKDSSEFSSLAWSQGQKPSSCSMMLRLMSFMCAMLYTMCTMLFESISQMRHFSECQVCICGNCAARFKICCSC